jgi:hypothetical protein
MDLAALVVLSEGMARVQTAIGLEAAPLGENAFRLTVHHTSSRYNLSSTDRSSVCLGDKSRPNILDLRHVC